MIETCLSRLSMPAAGLLLPVATYTYLKKMKLLPKNMLGLAAARLLLVYASFSLIALPMSTGIFQPQQVMDIDELEHEYKDVEYIRDFVSEDRKMYFYKGC